MKTIVFFLSFSQCRIQEFQKKCDILERDTIALKEENESLMSKNLLMETKLEELHETSVGLTSGAEELRARNRQLEQVD